MKINRIEAELLVSKLEDNANDYDFNWRLYAKLCIAAGQKEKFRTVHTKIMNQYPAAFYFSDNPISALLAAIPI
jgi:hypothetical protein